MADSAPCAVSEGANEGNNTRTDAYTVSMTWPTQMFAENEKPEANTVPLLSKINSSLRDFFTADTVYAQSGVSGSNCISNVLPFIVIEPNTRGGDTNQYGGTPTTPTSPSMGR